MSLNNLYLQSFPLLRSPSTVSVCSSNNGKKNRRRDVFISSRKYFPQQKQCSVPQRKNTTFFSELRPVKDTINIKLDSRESIEKSKHLEDRNIYYTKSESSDSMKSDFLIENQNRKNFSKSTRSMPVSNGLGLYFSRSKDIKSNNLQKTDFGNYFKIKLLKSNNTDPHSINNYVIEKPKNIPIINKATGNRGFNFSASNYITNVLTIDDIYPSKHDQPQKCLTNVIVQNPANEKLPNENEKGKPVENLSTKSKREAILNDYVSVYLNWRAAKSIEEHFDLFGKKDVQNRVRSATPKCRLEIFQRILNEKQATIPIEKIYEYKNHKIDQLNLMKDLYNTESIGFAVSVQNETKLPNDVDEEERSERTESVKENKISLEGSDNFSEIDWLECENFGF